MEQTDLEGLRQFVNKIHTLSYEEWLAFSVCWQKVKFKRKEVITRAGEVEKYLYFVIGGLQRAYYFDDYKEVTIVFTYPPSFSGVPDSFQLQIPSDLSFEAITSSTMLRLSYPEFLRLINQYPNIERFVRLATAAALKGVIKRQAEVMIFSAERKFKSLLTRSPHILNLVPHKYLASYLGIDATTFSKLLNSVMI
jgi:CRP-like cAMP-binding protein